MDEPARLEDEVCRRFARRIWAYGIRHLREEVHAADLVQQVLLVVLEALRAQRVREMDKLDSFVLGTCRHVVMDLKRAGSRRQIALEQYSREAIKEELPRLANEDLSRLMQCLRELDYRSRRILVMTFYEDLGANEIAADLETTSGNVRTIRHRSLRQLRECLERPACPGGPP